MPIKYVNVREKLCSILEKNPAYDFLNAVHKYLNAEYVFPEEIPSSFASAFKCCPVTSVDVERSFSDKRHKFSPEHMEKLILQYRGDLISSLKHQKQHKGVSVPKQHFIFKCIFESIFY